MTARVPHPLLYTLLILPFGAIGGFVTVALAFVATERGLTVEDGAALVAVGMLPHTWKPLWAPIADTTLSRRSWYLLSVALCALGVLAMGTIPLGPSTLRTMQLVVFVANLASTTLGMAVEGIMAHLTPEDRRGQAGGWFQAGNLGGSGIGGGAGLWLMQTLPAPWMSGAVMALLFLACAAPLLWLPDVPRDARTGGLGQAVGGVARELWTLVRARSGLFAAILCFLPISTGAAAGVLAQSAVAARWGAGADEVGLVNGFLSGGIAAFGCLVGGEICARMDARKVYAGVGALMACVALGMAASPLTPGTFVAWGLLYSFCTGLAYAAFTGFVLGVIGTSAAATKYNIFAALSNTPITYMGLVLASAVTAYGPVGMLWTEAAAGAVGLFVLALAAVVLLRPPQGRAAAA
jgi:PAT family beta-lactamase induction signal transducer AmpG